MTENWIVEGYALDSIAADTTDEYVNFDEAYEAVIAIRAQGKTARFIAPLGVERRHIEAFTQIGAVERT